MLAILAGSAGVFLCHSWSTQLSSRGFPGAFIDAVKMCPLAPFLGKGAICPSIQKCMHFNIMKTLKKYSTTTFLLHHLQTDVFAAFFGERATSKTLCFVSAYGFKNIEYFM